MEKQENTILIDWFSMTSKIHSPENFIQLLGLQDVVWEETKGAQGYQCRLYYDHISIHYNGREDMGIWLEMSGQGCRVFETHGHGDYDILFREWLDNEDEMNVTRIDIAFDDHEGLLDIYQIVRDTQALDPDDNTLEFVSKFKKRDVIWSHEDGGKPALTVQHGRKGSETMIRIYDKAAERGKPDQHWVRCEIQLRDDRASQFTLIPLPIGQAFTGVLLNYLRYIVPDENDENRWRWPMTQYWSNLVDDAEKISIYRTPGMEYNEERCKRYVINQAGNAIDACIQMYGEDEFIRMVQEREIKPNPKYQMIVEQHRLEVRREKLITMVDRFFGIGSDSQPLVGKPALRM